MAHFLRPPDWDPHTHRHSELVDPVVTVRQFGRFGLTRKAPTRIDHALVYVTPKGTYEAYPPPHRPGTARRYTAVYEVDMGVHPVDVALRLPSDNDAHEFVATAGLTWQVTDPAQYVRSGCRDVPRLLTGELEQVSRPVTRHFPIGSSAAAEDALLTALRCGKPLGEAAGLHTTWTVRLRRDTDGIAHERRLQAIHHAAREEILVQRRGAEVDAGIGARDLENGRHLHEQEIQRQRWERERALERARYELELQRYEAQKIDFYQRHLAHGGVQAWALQLARRPEDTELVLKGMRDHELALIQAQVTLVQKLLGSEGGEAHQVEGPQQLMLQMIHDFFAQRLPRAATLELPELPGWQPPPGYGLTAAPPETTGSEKGTGDRGGRKNPGSPGPGTPGGPDGSRTSGRPGDSGDDPR
ncbi:hypothetical protein [Streptomyces sp. NPDC051567]|uniref:hypothetical protein n=1 Tax=Streptomyces sp. NPDC051567 TaxID=3365660 RepID=UPI00378B6027